MQAITSVDQYRALVKDNKRRLGKTRTNCMLLPPAFAEPAAEGRLAFEQYDNGLLVRVDEGSYATLYYYWRPDAMLPRIEYTGSSPLYVEEAGNLDEERRAILEAFGMHQYKRNVQYVLDCTKECDGASADVKGYSIVRCEDESLASAVVSLWGRRLGAADIPLAHKQFLSRGDIVYCALSTAGDLAGAIWWQDQGKTRLMRHIVVDEHHVRRGIARALLVLCATDARQTGMLRVSTWISDTNAPSIALHEQMGYVATTKVVIQFVAK